MNKFSGVQNLDPHIDCPRCHYIADHLHYTDPLNQILVILIQTGSTKALTWI